MSATTTTTVRCWFCYQLFQMEDPSIIVNCEFCDQGIDDLDEKTQRILLQYNSDLESNYKHLRTPCTCEYCWKFKREPRIGRNHYSVIEALADSAQQMLVRENYTGTLDRVNRILKLTRNTIVKMPETPDNPRCYFRVTKRQRCSMPLVYGSCVQHGKKGVIRIMRLDRYFSHK